MDSLGGTREAGKDLLDSLRGTREAGKDLLDSLGGTREAPGKQERTKAWEAPGRQESTIWTAWEAPGRLQRAGQANLQAKNFTAWLRSKPLGFRGI